MPHNPYTSSIHEAPFNVLRSFCFIFFFFSIRLNLSLTSRCSSSPSSLTQESPRMHANGGEWRQMVTCTNTGKANKRRHTQAIYTARPDARFLDPFTFQPSRSCFRDSLFSETNEAFRQHHEPDSVQHQCLFSVCFLLFVCLSIESKGITTR